MIVPVLLSIIIVGSILTGVGFVAGRWLRRRRNKNMKCPNCKQEVTYVFLVGTGKLKFCPYCNTNIP